MIIKTSYPFMKPPPSARLIRGHHLAQGFGAFWPFNENSGLQVFDLSGNRKTGTLQGTAPSWTTGKFGSAVLLPGTDEYIDIDTTLPTLINDTVGTWIIWVRVIDATNGTQKIVAFGDTDNLSYLNLYVNYQGKLQAACAVTGRGNMWDIRSTNVNFTDGVWAQCVLVHDGVSPSLYFNGVPIAFDVITSTDNDVWFSALTGVDNGRIGCDNYNSNGNADFINMQISSLSFYNRVLLASEIAKLYFKSFCMLERKARVALLSGYTAPPVGAAGIMTTNTGFWGPTF